MFVLFVFVCTKWFSHSLTSSHNVTKWYTIHFGSFWEIIFGCVCYILLLCLLYIACFSLFINFRVSFSFVFNLSFPGTQCGRFRMMFRWPASRSHCQRRCLKKTSSKSFLMVRNCGTSWSPKIHRNHLVASVNLPIESTAKIEFPQRCERRWKWMAACSMHYFVWPWSWGVWREAWTVGFCQTRKTQGGLPMGWTGTSNLHQELVGEILIEFNDFHRFSMFIHVQWFSMTFLDFHGFSMIF